MARFLLGAFGQPGHAFPMIALAGGLVAHGHEVLVETWGHWQAPVEAAGAAFATAPEYSFQTPLPPYAAVARAAVQTRSLVSAWQPDVVVHDVLTLAPGLAAELEGVPAATLIPHVFPFPAAGAPPYSLGARFPQTAFGQRFWNSLRWPTDLGLRIGREQLNGTRARLGLPALSRLDGGLSPSLVLVGTYPGLEYPREWPSHVHVVGPLVWEPPSASVTPPIGEEPLVLVAPSTAQDPTHRLLRAALSGLRDLPVRVLATTNGRPLEQPVALGPRQKLVDWVSYSETMPQADLIVCHAGYGTLARALGYGVPVVAAPHVGDMAENAARLDWSGAGVRLPWRFLSGWTVRLAVQRALDPHEGFRERAQSFADWSAAHDPVATACGLLERLAAGERGAA